MECFCPRKNQIFCFIRSKRKQPLLSSLICFSFKSDTKSLVFIFDANTYSDFPTFLTFLHALPINFQPKLYYVCNMNIIKQEYVRPCRNFHCHTCIVKSFLYYLLSYVCVYITSFEGENSLSFCPLVSFKQSFLKIFVQTCIWHLKCVPLDDF